jgi:hypothetical protein
LLLPLLPPPAAAFFDEAAQRHLCSGAAPLPLLQLQ